jgi:hypothetical protein
MEGEVSSSFQKFVQDFLFSGSFSSLITSVWSHRKVFSARRLAWWVCMWRVFRGGLSLFIILSHPFLAKRTPVGLTLFSGCCGRGAAVIMECNNNLTSRPLWCGVGWPLGCSFFLFVISLQGVRSSSHGM